MQLLERLSQLDFESISDIYIPSDCRCFYKSLGEIQSSQISLSQNQLQEFLCHYLSQNALSLLDKGVEQGFSFEFSTYFIRAHCFLSSNQYALNLRIIPKHLKPAPILEELPALKTILAHPNGLFLISGATGSGKSTSAHHILEYLARQKPLHIVCIEDPIEFRHRSDLTLFTYREVGRDTQSFESGILSALRQDPDVIFVGELREKSALEAALLASQTGHLVIATIHGGDVSSTILRFLGAFEDRLGASYELAQCLLAVLLQVRENSKIHYEITPINQALKTLIKEQKFNQIATQATLSQQSCHITLA